MGELDQEDRELPLHEGDFANYRLIAAGRQPRPGQSLERLLAAGLIDADPYAGPGRYIPHDPRAAAQDLTASALRDLTALVDRLRTVPAVEALADDYDPHRFYGGPGSEFLPGATQMNARLGEIGAAATTEFLTVQPAEPADRDPEILRMGVERTRSALRRGVRVRSLYHRSAHDHAQTREYAQQLVTDGAEVRGSATPGPRMVIIDGRHLFIDNHVVADAEGNAGWHVSDRAAVAWARQVFEHAWNGATRWQDLREANEQPITERQRRILAELSAGYSQRQVGSRIGLSDRAVAGQLAAAREAAGCETTFQLMAWYGRVCEPMRT